MTKNDHYLPVLVLCISTWAFVRTHY